MGNDIKACLASLMTSTTSSEPRHHGSGLVGRRVFAREITVKDLHRALADTCEVTSVVVHEWWRMRSFNLRRCDIVIDGRR